MRFVDFDAALKINPRLTSFAVRTRPRQTNATARAAEGDLDIANAKAMDPEYREGIRKLRDSFETTRP